MSAGSEQDLLRCEVWDYDPDGQGEFLGQTEIMGNAAKAIGIGQVVVTDLLPANANRYQLQKSTKGHPGKYCESQSKWPTVF